MARITSLTEPRGVFGRVNLDDDLYIQDNEDNNAGTTPAHPPPTARRGPPSTTTPAQRKTTLHNSRPLYYDHPVYSPPRPTLRNSRTTLYNSLLSPLPPTPDSPALAPTTLTHSP